MKKDISKIFKDWAFDPSDISARKIMGLDGQEKLQVRLDLGILQMEMVGRPDGEHPHGQASMLAHYLDGLDAHREKEGSDETFYLDADACADLGQEGLQFYYRFVALLRLDDYEAVLQDTRHCLALIDLIRSYAEDEEDRIYFEHYRPYVMMVHTRTKGEKRLLKGDYEGALKEVEKGIDKIRSATEALEGMEPEGEIEALEAWAEEIKEQRPVSLKQRLREQLQEAIALEQYERAAKLRDRLNALRSPSF